MQLTVRRLKRKQKHHLTARKNAGISNNGLNARDRPRKPNWILEKTGAPNSTCLKETGARRTRSCQHGTPLGTAHLLGRNSGSFSFNEVWVTGLAASAVNASHETNTWTKLRKRCALGPQDLLTITLYRVTRQANTDENGRLRDDECD